MNISTKLASITLTASLLMLATTSIAGPSAHRTKEGSGLLNALIFGDSHHQAAEKRRPEEQNSSSPKTTDRQTETTAIPTDNSMQSAGSFDGIWKNHHGRTLLIKQIHRTLYLSGSSKHSAWQAQCVAAGASARCIGNGADQTTGEFQFETDLQLNNSSLQSDWSRHDNNGNTQSGHSVLNPA